MAVKETVAVSVTMAVAVAVAVAATIGWHTSTRSDTQLLKPVARLFVCYVYLAH